MASSSWTKPTTATILTGLTPNVHGMTDFYEYSKIRSAGFSPKRILEDDVVTIGECLGERGYATIYRNNNIHASHFFNMDQGFDDAPLIDARWDAGRMLDEFEASLAKVDADRPFFFFMLTRDPHIVYNPYFEYFEKFNRTGVKVAPDQLTNYSVQLRGQITQMDKADQEIPPGYQTVWVDLYDAELAQLDHNLSKLPGILERAGRADNTVIVFTADHGERFFDTHGPFGHSKTFMDQPLLHVPLLMTGAGLPQGMRVRNVVRTIDIYPTIAALAGAKVPDVVQGESLLPFIRGESPWPDLSAFSSYGLGGKSFSVIRGDFKLLVMPDDQNYLYNLADDPLETTNLADRSPDQVARLLKDLEAWRTQEEALNKLVSQGETRDLSPEVLDQLEALGYIDRD